MDYEKKYKEALKDMRVIYPNLKGDAKLAAEHAFPELKESEDERTRMALCDIVRDMPYMETELRAHGLTVEKTLAYLEKHKEPIVPFDTKLFQDGVKEGRRLEREDIKKEQKPENIDYISGIREELLGIENDAKDIDGLTESQWAAIRAAHRLLGEYIEEEQKSAEYLPTEKVYAIMTKLTELSASNLIPINSPEYLKIHQITKDVRSLLDYPMEQKPAEKQDYSGLNDFERAIHRGFLSAGVENVPVAIIKETAQECLAQMRPAEWSEEDSKRYISIGTTLETSVVLSKEDYDANMAWLRELVNAKKYSGLRPHWKPSEEQMEALKEAVFYFGNSWVSHKQEVLESLYNGLKSYSYGR